jgi:hypothetical protein
MKLRQTAITAILAFVGISAFASAAYAQVVDATAPGNPIVGVAATLGSNTSLLAVAGGGSGNAYPTMEAPPNAINDNLSDKYLNFQQSGAGFIVTPSALSVLTGVDMATANDAVERDPLVITIEGTNSPNATTTLNSSWTLIYNGASGLATDPGRNTFGQQVSFANALSFTSYRVLVQTVRTPTSANSFQFGEIELLAPVPEPSSLILAVMGVSAAAWRWRRRKNCG